MRCGRVCFGSGFGCAPPLLAGVLGCVCACVCAPLVRRHSWLGDAVWVCVPRLGFQLRPATPAWSVGVLCVLVCALRWYPAAPGWGVRRGRVCSGSGFGCTPPLPAGVLGCACLCVRSACIRPLLAGVCGVGVGAWARVSAAPRHSWLGCVVWVCVLGPGFGLYPATPGWVLGCACLCARSACTPPLVAGVCHVGVCAWARVWAAPRHSWLGCWGVYVLVCALRLYPATPGWGVRCWCVCLGSGFGCAPPLLVGVLGCVCACVRAPLVPRHSWLRCAVWACVLALGFRLGPGSLGWGVWMCVLVCHLRLYPAIPGWAVRAWAQISAAPRHLWLGCWGVRVCVRAPPVPRHPGWGVRGWAWVLVAPRHSWLGCWGLRVCVPSPLVPRHSWLGCAVWVRVLGLRFWLPPASPGWGVLPLCVFVCALRLFPASSGWGVRCGCVCLGSGSGCTPPLLAWVCGARVRCCLATVLVPWFVACCARCPVLRHPVAVVAWHLSLVVAGGVPLWRAWWPRLGAPRLVQSNLSRCSSQLSRRRGALPQPGGLRTRLHGVAARGTRRPAENRAHCASRRPPLRPGRWARSASYPSGPRDGVVPGGSLRRRSWAACAAVVCICGPGH